MARPMNATRGMGAVDRTMAFTTLPAACRGRFGDSSFRVKMSAESPK